MYYSLTEIVDVDRVREHLRSHRSREIPRIIKAATNYGGVDILDELLSDGVSPNLRVVDADYLSGVPSDFKASTTCNPDNDHWYPLYRACNHRIYAKGTTKEGLSHMITALLRHGADLYAVFPQAYFPGLFPRSTFPEIDIPVAPPGVPDDVRRSFWEEHGFWPDKYNFEEEFGNDSDEDDNDDDWEYTLRSVLHAILEDGLLIKPILDCPGITLDLEHRDPQGRTLLLSACRSSLGADALLDNTDVDLRDRIAVSRISRDPFPDSSDYPTASTLPPTAIKALLDLGADPLATDDEGKHMLHHLLEAYNELSPPKTPRIRLSLRYLVSRFPALVNQPDSKGTYPLHTAMQCVRRHRQARGIEISEPESSVADLIAAGANPHVRDAHGNNVLHYIADFGNMERWSGLTEIYWRASERSAATGRPAAARSLLDILLDQGVDVNARNDAGQSPIRILLDSGGAWMAKRARRRGIPDSIYPSKDIEKLADEMEGKVFDKFGAEGVDWNERDEQDTTLLHAVAAHDNMRTVWRCKYLQDRGVDPLARDTHGKTALDSAWGNSDVVEALQEYQALKGQQRPL
ncbi:hypothetical protein PISL3812_05916 [Talaromyces islandicus]|uniref:Uncharacterized protein n=1 Tax=Talaromyces islandicus TaxID=28573 RepID=A0A0U1M1L6_TALIS|nr:hypothetical protein PISL3812_05916 [Talaromyces islandicus]